jgi:outer membrane lipoprotein SlyB
MKKSFLAIAAISALVLSGCAATQSASIGGTYTVPVGKKVSASTSHFNLLALSPASADELDGVLQDLAKQCGGKKVTGITTHYAPRSFIIAIAENISATGYCAD